jgi:hypothetical protein
MLAQGGSVLSIPLRSSRGRFGLDSHLDGHAVLQLPFITTLIGERVFDANLSTALVSNKDCALGSETFPESSRA